MGLSKRFPDCSVSHTTTTNPVLPFFDRYYTMFNIDPSKFNYVPQDEEKSTSEKKTDKKQDENMHLKFADFIKIEGEGIYQGTTFNNIRSGFGKMLYTEQVNFHPEIIVKTSSGNDHNLNNWRYKFYEGMFADGKLNGPGMLW